MSQVAAHCVKEKLVWQKYSMLSFENIGGPNSNHVATMHVITESDYISKMAGLLSISWNKCVQLFDLRHFNSHFNFYITVTMAQYQQHY